MKRYILLLFIIMIGSSILSGCSNKLTAEEIAYNTRVVQEKATQVAIEKAPKQYEYNCSTSQTQKMCQYHAVFLEDHQQITFIRGNDQLTITIFVNEGSSLDKRDSIQGVSSVYLNETYCDGCQFVKQWIPGIMADINRYGYNVYYSNEWTPLQSK